YVWRFFQRNVAGTAAKKVLVRGSGKRLFVLPKVREEFHHLVVVCNLRRRLQNQRFSDVALEKMFGGCKPGRGVRRIWQAGDVQVHRLSRFFRKESGTRVPSAFAQRSCEPQSPRQRPNVLLLVFVQPPERAVIGRRLHSAMISDGARKQPPFFN